MRGAVMVEQWLIHVAHLSRTLVRSCTDVSQMEESETDEAEIHTMQKIQVANDPVRD